MIGLAIHYHLWLLASKGTLIKHTSLGLLAQDNFFVPDNLSVKALTLLKSKISSAFGIQDLFNDIIDQSQILCGHHINLAIVLESRTRNCSQTAWKSPLVWEEGL